MKISCKTKLVMALSISALALAAFRAQAAPISWAGAFTIAGDSDVTNNGDPIFAYDWNGVQSVNGVNFTGQGSGITTTGFGLVYTGFIPFIPPASELDSDYQGLLSGGYYEVPNAACIVTLNSLTIGNQYEVQIWVDDSRSCSAIGDCSGLSRSETVSDSNSNSVVLNYNSGNADGGGLGQYTIGVFTADATNEVINMIGDVSTNSEGPFTQLNAIQLRDLSISETPTFSPSPGSYLDAQTVTITSELGSTVFYTTDGSNPSNSITAMSGPSGSGSAIVTVSGPGTLTINAYATNGSANSVVAGATYTIGLTAPTFSPSPGTYTGGQIVTITSDPGTTILYTTDGSDPTNSVTAISGPSGSGSATVIVAAPGMVTINASAVNGSQDSPVGSATYTTVLVSQPGGITWEAPTTISGDSDVATNGDSVFAYDWNSSVQTVNGVNFTAPASGATLGGFNNIVGGVFLSGDLAPADQLDPAYQAILAGAIFEYPNALGTVTLNDLTIGDQYEVQLWVDDSRSCSSIGDCSGLTRSETVSDSNSNSVILYYNPGTSVGGGLGQYVLGLFTANSATEVISMLGDTTNSESPFTQLNAIQLRDLTTATPNFNPAGGTYLGAQTVTITSGAGSTIFYTTDGSNPTNSITAMSGASGSGSATIAIPAPTNMTIKAYATNSGLLNSVVGSATYITTTTLAAPTFNPPAGRYAGGQTVTITSAPGTTVFYTTNGGNPSNSITALSGGAGSGSATVILSAPGALTINAYATNGSQDSSIGSATYNLVPVSQPAGITWEVPATISGDSDVATNGATVFAYDWNFGGQSINGVNFTAAGSGITTTGFGNTYAGFLPNDLAPAGNLDPEYQAVLTGGFFCYPNTLCTVALNDLAIGNQYEVQLWVDDSRPCSSIGDCSGLTRSETVSDSYSNSVVLYYNPGTSAGGGLGQYALGLFTANSTNEVMNLLGNTGNSETPFSQINAIQLRLLLAAPVVSSFGGGGAGSFPLTFSGPSGQTYRVMTTTNLALPVASWTQLANGAFGLSPVTYTAIGATNTEQFYVILSP